MQHLVKWKIYQLFCELIIPQLPKYRNSSWEVLLEESRYYRYFKKILKKTRVVSMAFIKVTSWRSAASIRNKCTTRYYKKHKIIKKPTTSRGEQIYTWFLCLHSIKCLVSYVFSRFFKKTGNSQKMKTSAKLRDVCNGQSNL